MKPADRYIFIISRPTGAPTDPKLLIGVLEGLGVQVDLKYGAVLVDPSKSRFALRGTADANVIERVAHDSAIEVFADPCIDSI